MYRCQPSAIAYSNDTACGWFMTFANFYVGLWNSISNAINYRKCHNNCPRRLLETPTGWRGGGRLSRPFIWCLSMLMERNGQKWSRHGVGYTIMDRQMGTTNTAQSCPWVGMFCVNPRFHPTGGRFNLGLTLNGSVCCDDTLGVITSTLPAQLSGQ